MRLISATSKKFIVAYILLVGLPLLGLAGVLKAGRHLSAPVSVDGAWKLDNQLASGQCSQTLAGLQDSGLNISQSGQNLVLTSGPRSTGSGSIDGTDFSGSISLNEDQACGTANLTASIDNKTEPRSMSGTIYFAGCPNCTPLTYRAVRQTPSRRLMR